MRKVLGSMNWLRLKEAIARESRSRQEVLLCKQWRNNSYHKVRAYVHVYIRLRTLGAMDQDTDSDTDGEQLENTTQVCISSVENVGESNVLLFTASEISL